MSQYNNQHRNRSNAIKRWNNLQVLGAHVVHRCGQFMGLISLVAKSDWWRASETRRPVSGNRDMVTLLLGDSAEGNATL